MAPILKLVATASWFASWCTSRSASWLAAANLLAAGLGAASWLAALWLAAAALVATSLFATTSWSSFATAARSGSSFARWLSTAARSGRSGTSRSSTGRSCTSWGTASWLAALLVAAFEQLATLFAALRGTNRFTGRCSFTTTACTHTSVCRRNTGEDQHRESKSERHNALHGRTPQNPQWDTIWEKTGGCLVTRLPLVAANASRVLGGHNQSRSRRSSSAMHLLMSEVAIVDLASSPSPIGRVLRNLPRLRRRM